ncbi:pilus assembly protein PilP [Suttonella ornithocola]|uniref:Pilus assembly protein, PilP n=1 Tax=Suttonella ornithocola TaxID=279832 RepID=A0A380MXL6_9GAMM|nr:pilus assembly protein PilP [Suttonella ornithocola]SUO97299.1 Pilus assembly protein, PilP [Suttonella ornithocola]
MNKSLYKLLLIPSYLMLSGFLLESPQEEVGQFIRNTQNQMKASHRVDLPPIPNIPTYQPFEYQGGSLDPFKLKPFVTDAAVDLKPEAQTCESADCGDPPPMPHEPYFLEGFDLDKLRMVGTVVDGKKRQSVLIATPDAGVTEAKVGEYLGKNNGRIMSIYPDHIVIQEKQKVPRGWQNRMTTLELFN